MLLASASVERRGEEVRPAVREFQKVRSGRESCWRRWWVRVWSNQLWDAELDMADMLICVDSLGDQFQRI